MTTNNNGTSLLNGKPRGQQRGQIAYQPTSILKQPGNERHVLNLVDEKGKPKYIRFASGQIMRRNGSQN